VKRNEEERRVDGLLPLIGNICKVGVGNAGAKKCLGLSMQMCFGL